MKVTSTYVNCTNLTSSQIQAKIKTAQARLQTLEYIAGNKNYTKGHRYDAIVEAMVLEGQIVYLHNNDHLPLVGSVLRVNSTQIKNLSNRLMLALVRPLFLTQ